MLGQTKKLMDLHKTGDEYVRSINPSTDWLTKHIEIDICKYITMAITDVTLYIHVVTKCKIFNGQRVLAFLHSRILVDSWISRPILV